MLDVKPKPDQLIDETKERVGHLIEIRLPWLLGGLVVGGFMTLYIARFEDVIAEHISLAFFIPFIVYTSDAIGTQTETLFVRNITRGKTAVAAYLIKEFAIGLALGGIFGILVGLFALIMFQDSNVALSVGLAMAISVALAPIVAIIVAVTIKKLHKDPAIGSGPFATVIQDFLTIIIYFLVATVVVLGGF